MLGDTCRLLQCYFLISGEKPKAATASACCSCKAPFPVVDHSKPSKEEVEDVKLRRWFRYDVSVYVFCFFLSCFYIYHADFPSWDDPESYLTVLVFGRLVEPPGKFG